MSHTLVDVLKSHYNPGPNITAECYRFNNRRQKNGEAIAEYVAALRHLSKSCKFENTLDECLRDRFIEGLRSEAVLKRLLSKKDLTFASAIEVASSMETAEKYVTDMKVAGTERLQ